MAIVTTINGIDVAKLHETMDAISEAPTLAKFEFRVENEWVQGAHNRTTVRNFRGAGQEDASREKTFVFNNDEPAVLLGNDRSAKPIEFVLHALAGCLTTTLVYHAASRGIRLKSVASRLVGALDMQSFLGLGKEGRSGCEQIRVEFTIESDAPKESITELFRIAQGCSPVLDMLSNPIPIALDLKAAR